MTALSAPPREGREHRADGRLLSVLSANMLLDALEVSSLVVAGPSIGRDLGLAPATTQWLIGAFALGFGAALPAGRWLAGRLGRRRLFLAGLLGFALASLVGGLAGGPAVLIASRLVKGVCVALTAPTGLAIIATTFAEGPARYRALSVYSLFGASGFSLGLLESGLLTGASWRWVLVAPAPVALGLFVAARRLIPAEPATGPEPPEAPGQPGRWRDLARWPLLRSALGAAALNGPYWGFLFMLTYQLQAGWGWPAPLAGLAMLPASLPLALAAPFGARLVARLGPAPLIRAGALTPPLGYALYLLASPPQHYLTQVLPTLLLVGSGFALAFSALHLQATAGLSGASVGRASGLYQAAVQLGGVLALVAVVHRLPATGVGPSTRPAVALLLAVSLAGLGVALTAAGRRPRRS